MRLCQDWQMHHYIVQISLAAAACSVYRYYMTIMCMWDQDIISEFVTAPASCQHHPKNLLSSLNEI